jgi:hypothetical protein
MVVLSQIYPANTFGYNVRVRKKIRVRRFSRPYLTKGGEYIY